MFVPTHGTIFSLSMGHARTHARPRHRHCATVRGIASSRSKKTRKHRSTEHQVHTRGTFSPSRRHARYTPRDRVTDSRETDKIEREGERERERETHTYTQIDREGGEKKRRVFRVAATGDRAALRRRWARLLAVKACWPLMTARPRRSTPLRPAAPGTKAVTWPARACAVPRARARDISNLFVDLYAPLIF